MTLTVLTLAALAFASFGVGYCLGRSEAKRREPEPPPERPTWPFR